VGTVLPNVDWTTLVPAIPASAQQAGRWIFVLSLAYILTRKFVGWLRGASGPTGIALLGDAIFFSSSVMVLMGVWWPNVMAAIGDLTIYLVLAGLGGLFYTLEAIPKEGRRPDAIPPGWHKVPPGEEKRTLPDDGDGE
jgi:hypothetical protein